MVPHISQAKHVHFTGIKGVGMTAAALCIQDLNIPISGSDVTADFVTKQVLDQRGIKPSKEFSPENIPAEADTLIYTGAHNGQQNQEVLEAQKRGLRILSHAELVGELMAGKIGISVCGVGGKTSISAMLATILDYASKKPSFLIGVGKVLNLQVPGRIDSGEHFVAEADEYVVSPGYDQTPRFLYQHPHMIICTNIVHDHPDAYPTIDDTKTAFHKFFSNTDPDGTLILNGNSAHIRELQLSHPNIIYYGSTPEKNNWWVEDTFIGEGKQMVIFSNPDTQIKLTLSVPGKFNALNALAAYIAATKLGIDPTSVIQALQLFRGSMRRFEKMGAQNDMLFYDDYAHHPSQIMATLTAAKLWLPLNNIVALFQPHTYSRTKILLPQFAKSFTHADQVIITDIYASEREAKDDTISGYMLAEEVKKHHPNVQYVPYAELLTHLKEHLQPKDALFTLGAGNIYQIHQLLID